MTPPEPLEREAPPWRPRRRTALLLRWTLFASLLATEVTGTGEPGEIFLVDLGLGLLLVANLILTFLPPRIFRSTPLEFCLGLLDTSLISFVMFRADPSGQLCLFFFVLLAVTAATTRALHALGAAVALSVLYLLTRGSESGVVHLTIVPMFYAAALHFGDQVLHVRERDRRAGALARERQELQIVLRILDSIISSLDFPSVMYQLVSRIGDALGASRCSVVLVERAAGLDRAFVVAASDDRKITMLPIELCRYPELLLAISERRPVVVEDIEASEMLRPFLDELRRLNFRSLLVVPLLYREEILGALFLRAARRREFTDDDLRLCRAVASAAASAIKNSILYRSLEGRAREQEQMAARLQSLFDHSPDLILRLDENGRIAEANRRVATASGRPLHELAGLEISELIAGLPPVAEMLGGPQPRPAIDATLFGPAGRARSLSVTVGPVREPKGGAILIGRDVTEDRRASARRQQRQRLSRIGEIVAGVAHELRNPLSGVVGFGQLLLQGEPSATARRHVERILECSTRCQKIVDNLLTFARPSADEHKPLGLNGLVEKTLDALKHSSPYRNAEIVKVLEPELPYVRADFHQMQQVLTNLIVNAQQAIAGGNGTGRITVRTSSADGRVTVAVSDDGPGIRPEILPRIFDPFFSTKEQGKGTGLGLSISYGIVRDHGGEILVDSQAGRGATFSVILPVDERAQPPEATARSRPAPEGRGRSILAVDDEAMLLDLYLEILQSLGHVVDTAGTGSEALRKIRERDYDLVVSDVKMPELDGVQLFERVRVIKPEMARRFIFITGDAKYLADRQASSIRDLPCLLKPLSVEAIEAAIQKQLAEGPSALAPGG